MRSCLIDSFSPASTSLTAFTFDLQVTVQAGLNGTANYGIALLPAADSDTRTTLCASSDYATTSYRSTQSLDILHYGG